MKSMISVAIASLIIVALPSMAIADSSAGRLYINQNTNRIANQQARINQGINNGSISTRELANLSRRQNALNASILRDTQDGSLSRSERYNLNRRADNISRSIYNYKRN